MVHDIYEGYNFQREASLLTGCFQLLEDRGLANAGNSSDDDRSGQHRSRSEDGLDAWVYFGNSLLDQNLIVLFDDTDGEKYSRAGSECSKKIRAGCYEPDD